MKDFRKSVEKRLLCIRIFYVAVLVVLLNQCFGNFLSLPIPKEAFISEFQMGLLIGIEIVFLVLSTKYRKALKNENELQDLYNYEHDERKNMIKQKAGYPVMLISSIAILTGAVFAGYFNSVIFYTLAAAAVIQLLFCSVLKLIYSKKY